MDWFSTLSGIAIGLLLIFLRGKSANTSNNTSSNAFNSNQINFPNPSALSTSVSELQQLTPPNDRELQIAYYAALDLAQFKSSFLSRTSHELRSPLNALISSLQMIEAGLCDDPEEEKEYITMAHDGAIRFIGMLDEVLKISKLQSGRLKLNLTEVDLAIVLQEVYFITRHLAANRNIKLEIPMLEEEILIQADPLYLQQALTILVSRSIEAMNEGTIVLTLTKTHPILLTITDELPAEQWKESVTILTQPTEVLPEIPYITQASIVIPQEFSPAFRLVLARELLMSMGITITIAPSSLDHPEKSIHSIQCRFE